MGDVLAVSIIVAFFLVAATVAWFCRRITADAAVEAESETGAFDADPKLK
jgi:hypothetical protein